MKSPMGPSVMLAIMLVSPCSPTVRAMTAVPVEGLWWVQMHTIDPALSWTRGVLHVDSTGSFTDFLIADSGLGVAATGGVSLASVGAGSFRFRFSSIDDWHESMIIGRLSWDLFIGTGLSQGDWGGIMGPPPELTKTFIAGVRLDPEGYKPVDLVGTWGIVGLESTAVTSDWVRGWIDVVPGGAFTGSVSDSTSGWLPLIGTVTIATNGEVTTTINATWRGAMSIQRDIIFATQTRGPGFLEMDALVRLAGPYSVTQLVGRSGLASLRARAPPGRAEGVVTIGTGGNYRVSLRVDGGTPEVSTGTMLYNPTGYLGLVGDPTWFGVATPARDLFVGNAGGEFTEYFAATHIPPMTIEMMQLQSVFVPNDALFLGWFGAGGEVYDIYGNNDLAHPTCWTPEVTGILGVAPTRSIRDLYWQEGGFMLSADKARYYRVQTRLP